MKTTWEIKWTTFAEKRPLLQKNRTPKTFYDIVMTDETEELHRDWDSVKSRKNDRPLTFISCNQKQEKRKRKSTLSRWFWRKTQARHLYNPSATSVSIHSKASSEPWNISIYHKAVSRRKSTETGQPLGRSPRGDSQVKMRHIRLYAAENDSGHLSFSPKGG